ncbi:MAG: hypothetical protein OER86_13830, partial [Phycisphaerae bacterium]|nr:hypothetical protein [Phycisphaerae bacterium]
PTVLGSETFEKLGWDNGADPLAALGLTRAQVDGLNRLICGTGMIEGAPHLRDEHLAVFDCANRCGKAGQRFIAHEGHIRMMAAVQPFISGAISKTINLPAEAGVEDIESAYRLSWELGLKANALYRDGSKLSQPLNATADEADDEEAIEAGKEEVSEDVTSVANRVANVDIDSEPAAAAARGPVEKIVERVVERPMRRRLPDTRYSITHKFNVAGHEGYLTVGLYEDKSPGELFITMAKEGSTIGGLMDSLGTAISVALQYGVPIESLVNKFSHQRFEPAGMTDNRDIPFAKSLVDYIFRWMGMEFIAGYRKDNAPQRSEERSRPPAPVVSSVKPAPVRDKTPAAAPTAGRLADDRTVGSDGGERGREPGADAAAARGLRPVVAVDDPDLADRHQVKATPSLVKVTDASTQVMAITDKNQSMIKAVFEETSSTAVLNSANAQMMGDAPACDVCGSITVRNGTCYRCLNCGNSMGCS